MLITVCCKVYTTAKQSFLGYSGIALLVGWLVCHPKWYESLLCELLHPVFRNYFQILYMHLEHIKHVKNIFFSFQRYHALQNCEPWNFAVLLCSKYSDMGVCVATATVFENSFSNFVHAL